MKTSVRFSPKPVNQRLTVPAVEPLEGLGNARRMKTHPIYLREWRKKMNWTQVRLADAIGTDHTTIGRYERGVLRVDDLTFRKIADCYGISVAELSCDPADQAKAQHMHRLMLGWAALDPDDAKIIADMTERLAAARQK